MTGGCRREKEVELVQMLRIDLGRDEEMRSGKEEALDGLGEAGDGGLQFRLPSEIARQSGEGVVEEGPTEVSVEVQELRVVGENLGEEPDLSEVDRGDAGDDPAEQRAAVEEGVFGQLAGLQKPIAVRPLLEPLVSVGWNGEDGLEGRLDGEGA